jgi:hypothetical protein
LKLQRLQNKVLGIIGKFPKTKPVRKLDISFQVPYIYDSFPSFLFAPIWELAPTFEHGADFSVS